MRFVIAFLMLALTVSGSAGAPVAAKVSVCFTPGHDCEAQIVRAIDAARSEIKVQAYDFSSKPIGRALIAAARRNVEVLVILDKRGDRRYSFAPIFVKAGVPVWIDYKPRIAHNKLIIIDRHLVIGGSYNYTYSAQHYNAENVTFSESKNLAEVFIANWNRRWHLSRAFGMK